MLPLGLIPVFFVLALIAPAAWALVTVYRRERPTRAITCPGTGQSATIQIDARHAIAMHALGENRRRVGHCSLWPEQASCGQHCVK